MATSAEQAQSSTSAACESTESDQCWQSPLGNPLERLSAMYNLSKLTDLTVTFPGHQEVFKVHRLVLAMSSPVFECMLFGPMAEEGELELPEDPPEAFKWLMQYIYCGQTSFPDVKTATMVYHLANKYQINVLCTLCSEYLQNNVNGSNLPLVYDTCVLLEDSALVEKCNKVLLTSAESTLSSSDIGQLSRESVKRILQEDLGVKSEISVFKGLVHWGSAQVNQSPDRPETQRNIRQEIEEFLPLVRFLTVTLDEYVEHVMPSNILTTDESAAILMNIKRVNNIPLPQVCSQEDKRRTLFDLANIHKVSLWQSYYNYGRSQYSLDTRQLLISNMTVSKDIYLSYILLQLSQSIAFQRWRLEVIESSGDVLGEVTCDEVNDTQAGNTNYTSVINAKLDIPVLMNSDKVYNLWLHCLSYADASNNFSAAYKNMNIKGCYHFHGTSELGFWCFDDTL